MTFGLGSDTKTQNVMIKYPFVKELCSRVHGSGIDYDWHAEETRQNIRLYNSFHLMDENGMYYANADFVLILPKTNPRKFEINYTDRTSRYYGEKHDIKEYLYQTIDWAFEDLSVRERRKIHNRVINVTKRKVNRK
jgi:hypothetical protein